MKENNTNQKKWMWLRYKSAEDCITETMKAVFAYFRRDLAIEKVPVSCAIRITADSRYKLYVNELLVEVGPSKGNDTIWYHDVINIAPYLKEGKNVIAVIVLHYTTEHWEGNSSVYRTKTPGLYVDDGLLEKTVQCETWKCKLVENIHIVSENSYFAPLQIYEETQGEAALQGWMSSTYDVGGWEEPRYYSDSEIAAVLRVENQVERTIPFMKVGKARNLSEGIHVEPHTVFTKDFSAGELMTAYLNLQMIGGADTKIKLLQAECYAGDIKVKEGDPYGSLPKKSDRTDAALQLYGHTDEYHVAGVGILEKPEGYEPFWFRTFRYIRLTIETADEAIDLLPMTYREVGYPLEVLSNVETSNSEMRAIWDICERSLRRCMHETYEDCPFYEQLQYTMDSRSQILYTYVISADPRLALKCMDDFKHSSRTDGMLNCSYPNYETNVIPGFSIFYIGMIYDYMMYFGEKTEIQKHLQTMKGVLHYFQNNMDKRGIVAKIGDVNRPGNDWSFIDWTTEWDETNGVPTCTKSGPITMESLLYVLGLQYAKEIAKYMQEPEKAVEYETLAEQVMDAIRTDCIGTNGMIQDGPGIESYSQHCQVFAIIIGLVTPDEGKKLLEETFTNKEEYPQCSVAMMFYLFRALEICDMYEYTESLWDIWRKMLYNHMTTCAEDTLMSRSDCHAWGALALYELPAAVLGVRPTKPGCAELQVKPYIGQYSWAKGNVVTPKGMIKVAWKKKSDGKIELKIDASELDHSVKVRRQEN